MNSQEEGAGETHQQQGDARKYCCRTLTRLPLETLASAEMQLPRELRDLLIAAPSLSRAPVAPVPL